MTESKLSKTDIALALANNWAKTGASMGANVVASPYYMIKALMEHGYTPGTHDVKGVTNAADVALGTMGMSSIVPKPTNSIYMFGGRRSKTADMDALHEAIKMDKEGGVSPRVIFDQTGWNKNEYDKLWRYRIPGARESKVITPDKLGPKRLPDIWDYPELYQAYPNMKDIKIHYGESPGGGSYTRAKYEGDTPTMHFSQEDIYNPLASDKTKKKIYAHEGQHHIQAEEGFVGGFNPLTLERSEYLKNKYRQDIKRHIDELMKLPAYQDQKYGFQTAQANAFRKVGKDVYTKNLGEWEARKAGEDATAFFPPRQYFFDEMPKDLNTESLDNVNRMIRALQGR